MVIETPSFYVGFSFFAAGSLRAVREGLKRIHVSESLAVTGTDDQKAIWSVYLKVKKQT